MPIDAEKFRELNKVLQPFPPEVVDDFFWHRLAREGSVTDLKGSHIVTGPFGRTGCTRTRIWVMGGRASTGEDGQAVIRLNDYLCLSDSEESGSAYSWPSIIHQPWFVATPVSDSPVLLTTTYEIEAAQPPAQVSTDTPDLVPDVYETAVRLTSWSLDGTRAPHVQFSWNCIVEGARWIFIGG